MSVAAPFRRTIEDIAENLGDVIIIIIGIIIFYALITIGSKLWSGISSLFAGIQGLNLGAAGVAPPTGGVSGGGPTYTTQGGSTITPVSGITPGTVTWPAPSGLGTYVAQILPGGPRAQIGQVGQYQPPPAGMYVMGGTPTSPTFTQTTQRPSQIFAQNPPGTGIVYYNLPTPTESPTLGGPGIISMPTKVQGGWI